MQIAPRRPRALALLLPGLLLAFAGPTFAVQVEATGGNAQLALPLDDTQAPPATLIGISPDLTQLGAGKIQIFLGSPANSNTAAVRPTTATLDPADPAGTFTGSIELRGFVTYLIPGPSNIVELGDFSLAFDAARAGTLNGQASGFFLRNNRPGQPAIPFDIATGFHFTSDTSFLNFSGTLLTAPDLSARYEPFTGSQLGKPFGSIDLTATVQPIPLPPAFYPATLVLAGVVTAQAHRARRRTA